MLFRSDKEKVDVTLDFITSQGNKLLLTTAAESQAKSGHDILAFSTWLSARYADQLVPMNDVVEPLIKTNSSQRDNGQMTLIPASRSC